MKRKFAVILITSIISILHAKGYPIAWGYIYRYIDGQLVPVSGAKPLILEGNPPYFPSTSTN
jgi:ABC-type thiamin/hydroxymethylpyrimidine transport system permease subunit